MNLRVFADNEQKSKMCRFLCVTDGENPISHQPYLEAVKQAVKTNCKKLSVAKAELEEGLNKNFSGRTLRRYVKKTVDAINASENVPYTNATKRSTS